MSMQRISKNAFREQFEDSIAIIEADYQVVCFRYFISKMYGLGVHVTYRFNTVDCEHEYYIFQVSKEIIMHLQSAYIYITDKELRNKTINSEMISIFNAELQNNINDLIENTDIITINSEIHDAY